MKRSVDDISSTMLVANKKRSKPTPREQRHVRRDKVREEEKDRKIEQKQAKKRGREEEVDSIKGRVESKLSNTRLKATHSPIQMASTPLGSHQRVIGVTETGLGKAAAFVSHKPKMRVIIPSENFRPSAPIIEEWESDSDNDSTISPISDQPKHTPIKINFVKLVECVECGENEKQAEKPRSFTQNPKGAGQKETRPVWDNTARVNHQNKLTHPHPKRNFVPAAILTQSGQVLVNAAKQSSHKAAASVSAARRVNTAAPRPNVNSARSMTTQDLVIIKLIQRVKRLERELKARTPPIKIQKAVQRWQIKKNLFLY
nr:DEAD-box ATP-dependent RNA helicase 21 [Tanacetum cinerariifolium]